MAEIQRPIIFEHIPKTAGTTLLGILARHFPNKKILHITTDHRKKQLEDFDLLPLEDRMKYSLIFGHGAYQTKHSLPDGLSCLTFMRNPIDRVISNYNFIFGEPSHQLYHEVVVKKMDFRTYLTSGISNAVENYMTRAFALINFKEYKADPAAATLIALQNLDRDFIYIGLVEKFDLSVLLLSKLFNWSKGPYYYRENVSKVRAASREELNEDVIGIIREKNQMDFKLYDYATQRFSRSVEQFGDSTGLGLEEFRQKNHVYSRRRKPKKMVRDALRGTIQRVKKVFR